MAICALSETEAFVRSDFEFGFFGIHLLAHGWGIAAAAIVALALIANAGAIVCKLKPRDLAALLWATLIKGAQTAVPPTLSSPAEQAERSEGKGTQVEMRDKSRRASREKSRTAEQVLTPVSPSLARAEGNVPSVKQRMARARRG
jgi:hypothetical protein